ncbi:uncharacterized protein LOC101860660 isoform X2 [Aplysia californica]|uniref:Uncharacterized protein LOC101860660 isoform X2 n=1 Tax=Aplysia californica TaxID=6500 RepID=A0ABM0JS54_APLCA|nr:uncharacterized protein LOC101860660 isoform X2 [Aplysia californica]
MPNRFIAESLSTSHQNNWLDPAFKKTSGDSTSLSQCTQNINNQPKTSDRRRFDFVVLPGVLDSEAPGSDDSCYSARPIIGVFRFNAGQPSSRYHRRRRRHYYWRRRRARNLFRKYETELSALEHLGSTDSWDISSNPRITYQCPNDLSCRERKRGSRKAPFVPKIKAKDSNFAGGDFSKESNLLNPETCKTYYYSANKLPEEDSSSFCSVISPKGQRNKERSLSNSLFNEFLSKRLCREFSSDSVPKLMSRNLIRHGQESQSIEVGFRRLPQGSSFQITRSNDSSVDTSTQIVVVIQTFFIPLDCLSYVKHFTSPGFLPKSRLEKCSGESISDIKEIELCKKTNKHLVYCSERCWHQPVVKESAIKSNVFERKPPKVTDKKRQRFDRPTETSSGDSLPRHHLDYPRDLNNRDQQVTALTSGEARTVCRCEPSVNCRLSKRGRGRRENRMAERTSPVSPDCVDGQRFGYPQEDCGPDERPISPNNHDPIYDTAVQFAKAHGYGLVEFVEDADFHSEPAMNTSRLRACLSQRRMSATSSHATTSRTIMVTNDGAFPSPHSSRPGLCGTDSPCRTSVNGDMRSPVCAHRLTSRCRRSRKCMVRPSLLRSSIIKQATMLDSAREDIEHVREILDSISKIKVPQTTRTGSKPKRSKRRMSQEPGDHTGELPSSSVDVAATATAAADGEVKVAKGEEEEGEEDEEIIRSGPLCKYMEMLSKKLERIRLEETLTSYPNERYTSVGESVVMAAASETTSAALKEKSEKPAAVEDRVSTSDPPLHRLTSSKPVVRKTPERSFKTAKTRLRIENKVSNNNAVKRAGVSTTSQGVATAYASQEQRIVSPKSSYHASVDKNSAITRCEHPTPVHSVPAATVKKNSSDLSVDTPPTVHPRLAEKTSLQYRLQNSLSATIFRERLQQLKPPPSTATAAAGEEKGGTDCEFGFEKLTRSQIELVKISDIEVMPTCGVEKFRCEKAKKTKPNRRQSVGTRTLCSQSGARTRCQPRPPAATESHIHTASEEGKWGVASRSGRHSDKTLSCPNLAVGVSNREERSRMEIALSSLRGEETASIVGDSSESPRFCKNTTLPQQQTSPAWGDGSQKDKVGLTKEIAKLCSTPSNEVADLTLTDLEGGSHVTHSPPCVKQRVRSPPRMDELQFAHTLASQSPQGLCGGVLHDSWPLTSRTSLMTSDFPSDAKTPPREDDAILREVDIDDNSHQTQPDACLNANNNSLPVSSMSDDLMTSERNVSGMSLPPIPLVPHRDRTFSKPRTPCRVNAVAEADMSGVYNKHPASKSNLLKQNVKDNWKQLGTLDVLPEEEGTGVFHGANSRCIRNTRLVSRPHQSILSSPSPVRPPSVSTLLSSSVFSLMSSDGCKQLNKSYVISKTESRPGLDRWDTTSWPVGVWDSSNYFSTVKEPNAKKGEKRVIPSSTNTDSLDSCFNTQQNFGEIPVPRRSLGSPTFAKKRKRTEQTRERVDINESFSFQSNSLKLKGAVKTPLGKSLDPKERNRGILDTRITRRSAENENNNSSEIVSMTRSDCSVVLRSSGAGEDSKDCAIEDCEINDSEVDGFAVPAIATEQEDSIQKPGGSSDYIIYHAPVSKCSAKPNICRKKLDRNTNTSYRMQDSSDGDSDLSHGAFDGPNPTLSLEEEVLSLIREGSLSPLPMGVRNPELIPRATLQRYYSLGRRGALANCPLCPDHNSSNTTRRIHLWSQTDDDHRSMIGPPRGSGAKFAPSTGPHRGCLRSSQGRSGLHESQGETRSSGGQEEVRRETPAWQPRRVAFQEGNLVNMDVTASPDSRDQVQGVVASESEVPLIDMFGDDTPCFPTVENYWQTAAQDPNPKLCLQHTDLSAFQRRPCFANQARHACYPRAESSEHSPNPQTDIILGNEEIMDTGENGELCHGGDRGVDPGGRNHTIQERFLSICRQLDHQVQQSHREMSQKLKSVGKMIDKRFNNLQKLVESKFGRSLSKPNENEAPQISPESGRVPAQSGESSKSEGNPKYPFGRIQLCATRDRQRASGNCFQLDVSKCNHDAKARENNCQSATFLSPLAVPASAVQESEPQITDATTNKIQSIDFVEVVPNSMKPETLSSDAAVADSSASTEPINVYVNRTHDSASNSKANNGYQSGRSTTKKTGSNNTSQKPTTSNTTRPRQYNISKKKCNRRMHVSTKNKQKRNSRGKSSYRRVKCRRRCPSRERYIIKSSPVSIGFCHRKLTSRTYRRLEHSRSCRRRQGAHGGLCNTCLPSMPCTKTHPQSGGKTCRVYRKRKGNERSVLNRKRQTSRKKSTTAKKRKFREAKSMKRRRNTPNGLRKERKKQFRVRRFRDSMSRKDNKNVNALRFTNSKTQKQRNLSTFKGDRLLPRYLITLKGCKRLYEVTRRKYNIAQAQLNVLARENPNCPHTNHQAQIKRMAQRFERIISGFPPPRLLKMSNILYSQTGGVLSSGNRRHFKLSRRSPARQTAILRPCQGEKVFFVQDSYQQRMTSSEVCCKHHGTTDRNLRQFSVGSGEKEECTDTETRHYQDTSNSVVPRTPLRPVDSLTTIRKRLKMDKINKNRSRNAAACVRGVKYAPQRLYTLGGYKVNRTISKSLNGPHMCNCSLSLNDQIKSCRSKTSSDAVASPPLCAQPLETSVHIAQRSSQRSNPCVSYVCGSNPSNADKNVCEYPIFILPRPLMRHFQNKSNLRHSVNHCSALCSKDCGGKLGLSGTRRYQIDVASRESLSSFQGQSLNETYTQPHTKEGDFTEKQLYESDEKTLYTNLPSRLSNTTSDSHQSGTFVVHSNAIESNSRASRAHSDLVWPSDHKVMSFSRMPAPNTRPGSVEPDSMRDVRNALTNSARDQIVSTNLTSGCCRNPRLLTHPGTYGGSGAERALVCCCTEMSGAERALGEGKENCVTSVTVPRGGFKGRPVSLRNETSETTSLKRRSLRAQSRSDVSRHPYTRTVNEGIRQTNKRRQEKTTQPKVPYLYLKKAETFLGDRQALLRDKIHHFFKNQKGTEEHDNIIIPNPNDDKDDLVFSKRDGLRLSESISPLPTLRLRHPVSVKETQSSIAPNDFTTATREDSKSEILTQEMEVRGVQESHDVETTESPLANCKPVNQNLRLASRWEKDWSAAGLGRSELFVDASSAETRKCAFPIDVESVPVNVTLSTCADDSVTVPSRQVVGHGDVTSGQNRQPDPTSAREHSSFEESSEANGSLSSKTRDQQPLTSEEIISANPLPESHISSSSVVEDWNFKHPSLTVNTPGISTTWISTTLGVSSHPPRALNYPGLIKRNESTIAPTLRINGSKNQMDNESGMNMSAACSSNFKYNTEIAGSPQPTTIEEPGPSVISDDSALPGAYFFNIQAQMKRGKAISSSDELIFSRWRQKTGTDSCSTLSNTGSEDRPITQLSVPLDMKQDAGVSSQSNNMRMSHNDRLAHSNRSCDLREDENGTLEHEDTRTSLQLEEEEGQTHESRSADVSESLENNNNATMSENCPDEDAGVPGKKAKDATNTPSRDDVIEEVVRHDEATTNLVTRCRPDYDSGATNQVLFCRSGFNSQGTRCRGDITNNRVTQSAHSPSYTQTTRSNKIKVAATPSHFLKSCSVFATNTPGRFQDATSGSSSCTMPMSVNALRQRRSETLGNMKSVSGVVHGRRRKRTATTSVPQHLIPPQKKAKLIAEHRAPSQMLGARRELQLLRRLGWQFRRELRLRRAREEEKRRAETVLSCRRLQKKREDQETADADDESSS